MSHNDEYFIVEPDQSENFPIRISSEAIVVVDMVESTFTSNLFGWYTVGRNLLRELRNVIKEIGADYNLHCIKSTGDGYLLTYGNSQSAELSVVHAMDASLKLINYLKQRNINHDIPEERTISVRIAIHFGQVDIIDNDREGPHVSYTFRLEAINREALQEALNAIPAQELPLRNYIICSEEVKIILQRRLYDISPVRIGMFRFKGFPDWHEVFIFYDNE
jgi:hypothetical protein